MTTEYLEKQLANYKQVLLASLGAAVTLLATAIADMPNRPAMYFPGWYAVWFVLLLATFTPAVILLAGSEWRKLPFAERLNTIFGYLAATWIVLVAFGLKSNNAGAISWPTWWSFLSGIGIVMGIVYWFLRRRYLNSPEAIFP
jgi:magnesium-transporting ATPase (P-type)